MEKESETKVRKPRMTKSEKLFIENNFEAFKNNELSKSDSQKYLELITKKTR